VRSGPFGSDRRSKSVRAVDAQVHALLRFLLDTGFNLVPVPQGLDERGREVLSWLEGTPVIVRGLQRCSRMRASWNSPES
jgi:hypothetical protein